MIISCFSRYLRGVSAGQPSISLLPLFRSVLKRLLAQPRLFPLHNQPAAACRHPQLREEVWLHAEGNQGVRLWRWHLHRLPHGLGKDSMLLVNKLSAVSQWTVRVLSHPNLFGAVKTFPAFLQSSFGLMWPDEEVGLCLLPTFNMWCQSTADATAVWKSRCVIFNFWTTIKSICWLQTVKKATLICMSDKLAYIYIRSHITMIINAHISLWMYTFPFVNQKLEGKRVELCIEAKCNITAKMPFLISLSLFIIYNTQL